MYPLLTSAFKDTMVFDYCFMLFERSKKFDKIRYITSFTQIKHQSTPGWREGVRDSETTREMHYGGSNVIHIYHHQCVSIFRRRGIIQSPLNLWFESLNTNIIKKNDKSDIFYTFIYCSTIKLSVTILTSYKPYSNYSSKCS